MKKLCGDCELQTLANDLLRDMLIISLANKRLQERLLRESDLTLEKVISTCQNAELTHQQAKSMQQSSSRDCNVDSVHKFTQEKYQNKESKYNNRVSDYISVNFVLPLIKEALVQPILKNATIATEKDISQCAAQIKRTQRK